MNAIGFCMFKKLLSDFNTIAYYFFVNFPVCIILTKRVLFFLFWSSCQSYQCKTYSSSLEHIQCVKHLPETSWVIFLILCWDAYVLLLARSAFLCFLALRISSSFWGRKKFERISDSVLNVNIFTKYLSLKFS